MTYSRLEVIKKYMSVRKWKEYKKTDCYKYLFCVDNNWEWDICKNEIEYLASKLDPDAIMNHQDLSGHSRFNLMMQTIKDSEISQIVEHFEQFACKEEI